MDRIRRARLRLLAGIVALAALFVPLPTGAAVPYQGWTPSSFGMVPECGKYRADGYLAPGCLFTRRIKASPVVPGMMLAGTLRHGVWVSYTGSHWIPLAPHCLSTSKSLANATDGILPCGVEDIAFDPFDGDTFYVSTFEFSSPYLRGFEVKPGGVYKTTDGGRTWTHLSRAIKDLRGAALAVIRRTPGEKATIMAGNFQHAEHDVGVARSLAISYDDGAKWTTVRFTPVKGCSRDIVSASSDLVATLTVHPTNPNIVYAGSNGGLFMTTNRGRTWSNVLAKCYQKDKTNVGTIWAVAVAPDGKSLYAGVWDGTIRVTSAANPRKYWRDVLKIGAASITNIMFDRRDRTGSRMYVAAIGGPTRDAAGVYRVRLRPSADVQLLTDNYMAGINHQLSRLPTKGPYNLVKDAPAFWLAQSTVDPDVIYLSQAAGGIFWRSEGEPAPQPPSTNSPPPMPAVPTAMPTVPGLPPVSTNLPTALPTPTPSL